MLASSNRRKFRPALDLKYGGEHGLRDVGAE